MEQLTYIPFRCKLRLSRQEFIALGLLFGRLEYKHQVLHHRAVAEWAVGKRMAFANRLLQPRPHYNLTLNAIDAWMATTILADIPLYDEYEEVLVYKIQDHVARLMW